MCIHNEYINNNKNNNKTNNKDYYSNTNKKNSSYNNINHHHHHHHHHYDKNLYSAAFHKIIKCTYIYVPGYLEFVIHLQKLLAC